MAFNTILKTVKQKDTYCISLSTYTLPIVAGEFSGVTGITAAIFEEVKTILRLQAITRMMQKSGNRVCSACSFGLSAFWFLKFPPRLSKFCSTFRMANPQQSRRKTEVLVHSSVCVSASKSILQPRFPRTAVLLSPIARSSLPRLVPLVPSTAGVAMRMNTKSDLRKSR